MHITDYERVTLAWRLMPPGRTGAFSHSLNHCALGGDNFVQKAGSSHPNVEDLPLGPRQGTGTEGLKVQGSGNGGVFGDGCPAGQFLCGTSKLVPFQNIGLLVRL